MTISRRKFVEGAVVTSIVAGTTLQSKTLAANHETKSRTSTPTNPIDYYNKSTFAAYIDSDFRVVTGRNETWLRLVLVDDLPTHEPSMASRECFRLLFSEAAGTPLAQGTYQFEHSALGQFALFIVPGNPANAKRHYEAVFNRLTSSSVSPPTSPSNPRGKNRGAQGVEIEIITKKI